MSKALIEKLKRARETGVTVHGHTFTIRRPTDEDAQQMSGLHPVDFVKRFVVGWDLAESDFDPGGGPEKVPFDRDLWEAWIADHAEYWDELAMPMLDAYKAHVEARKEHAKN